MTLYQLTGQESGIIVYSDGSIIVANWLDYDDDALPRDFMGFLMAMPTPDDAGRLASATRREVEDIRDELDGRMYIDDDGELESTLDIVHDDNDDIPALFFDLSDGSDLNHCHYKPADGMTDGVVYDLADGTKIIAPCGWC